MEKVLPFGGQTASAGLNGVGKDTQGISEEELGDVRLVVGQVVVVGGLELDVWPVRCRLPR